MRRLSHDARTRDSRLTAVPVARCQKTAPVSYPTSAFRCWRSSARHAGAAGATPFARLIKAARRRGADRPIADARRLPEGRSASIYDHCQARLMDAPASTPRCIELIFVSREGIKARVAELTRSAPQQRAQTRRRNDAMVWSTPEIREVCVGMEVTSYLSAEM